MECFDFIIIYKNIFNTQITCSIQKYTPTCILFTKLHANPPYNFELYVSSYAVSIKLLRKETPLYIFHSFTCYT